MYRQNFRIIFFFNEAKNAGIAYVLARIFNEIAKEKRNRLRKFPIDNCGLVLSWIRVRDGLRLSCIGANERSRARH